MKFGSASKKATPVNPRISINQLAKYLSASANPGARRRIIMDQKQPKTFALNYYDYALKPITRFLLGKCQDEEILVKAIDDLSSGKGKHQFDETRMLVNSDAVQAFLDSYEQLNLEGLKPTAIANNCPKVIISGVEISVRPEILLTGTHKNQKIKGALKFYFGKNDPLDKGAAPYITAVLSRLLHEHFPKHGELSRKHCQVHDVFAGTVLSAPASETKRFRDVEYACKEIAMWWHTLDNEE